ncbi:MAG: hypothetical protein Q7T66_07090 [Herminiimonas sp.]|uniref:hypothetical protein n=1 Tax=Herminiimonas sp. TaxID=1926289 RepID=UPI002719D03C|nr:hypothetical protein [Herminiimonas sp.]MDO9420408.1 hypothetical protein [Herminiimonas sp.]
MHAPNHPVVNGKTNLPSRRTAINESIHSEIGFAAPAPTALHHPQSFFTRSSVDQRIYAANGGAELIPITLLPRFIHLQYQSIKNLISRGEFPLPVVKFAGRNYVKTETLVRFLESCERGEVAPVRRSGRKSNRERLEAKQVEVAK